MAKTPGKKATPKNQTAAETPTPADVATEAIAKARGPRGVPETAMISNVVPNPKREGSKAQRVFAHYRDGMTVGEFVESLKTEGLDKEATPNLVYDAKHGFIQIEGYNPGEIIQPKPKAEKKAKPKAEKKAKPAKVKPVRDEAAAAEADAAAVEETIE